RLTASCPQALPWPLVCGRFSVSVCPLLAVQAQTSVPKYRYKSSLKPNLKSGKTQGGLGGGLRLAGYRSGDGCSWSSAIFSRASSYELVINRFPPDQPNTKATSATATTTFQADVNS